MSAHFIVVEDRGRVRHVRLNRPDKINALNAAMMHGIAQAVSGADPERIEYYQMQHTTRPAMQQGAVIVRNGIPILLSPHNIAAFEAM